MLDKYAMCNDVQFHAWMKRTIVCIHALAIASNQSTKLMQVFRLFVYVCEVPLLSLCILTNGNNLNSTNLLSFAFDVCLLVFYVCTCFLEVCSNIFRFCPDLPLIVFIYLSKILFQIPFTLAFSLCIWLFKEFFLTPPPLLCCILCAPRTLFILRSVFAFHCLYVPDDGCVWTCASE